MGFSHEKHKTVGASDSKAWSRSEQRLEEGIDARWQRWNERTEPRMRLAP